MRDLSTKLRGKTVTITSDMGMATHKVKKVHTVKPGTHDVLICYDDTNGVKRAIYLHDIISVQ